MLQRLLSKEGVYLILGAARRGRECGWREWCWTFVFVVVCGQAAVNGDSRALENLSQGDGGPEGASESSPLTAAEPPSPFSPKESGDAASTPGESLLTLNPPHLVCVFCFLCVVGVSHGSERHV